MNKLGHTCFFGSLHFSPAHTKLQVIQCAATAQTSDSKVPTDSGKSADSNQQENWPGDIISTNTGKKEVSGSTVPIEEGSSSAGSRALKARSSATMPYLVRAMLEQLPDHDSLSTRKEGIMAWTSSTWAEEHCVSVSWMSLILLLPSSQDFCSKVSGPRTSV